jgi:hypothetical protein
MKNRKNKILSSLILMSLVMVSQMSYAGLSEKFNQYLGNESAYTSSFYIILGVIGVGVIGKICQYLFMNEEDKPVSRVKVSHYRHHHPRIIKKTN